ncbi:hypothetical protein G7048_20340 [Diaphorobacter sp. HDW4B]|uniref:hypothetical protein n=1 Tax=Diaphorobacter sp. HDW4B TaxID=2714925 RepID=UPI00140CE8C3|nr:hypothetical protein [Diaphorobacter sp. HDW4B]QIL72497.1 hypothetical protein G7048_20340 [Diaphorobacter sp. HDW4B]
MRPAHSCFFLAAMLLMATTFASAQSQHPHPPPLHAESRSDALDPQAPSLPLAHQSLQNSGALVRQPGDWRAANKAVGEFPNGHADLVQWEAQQAPAKAAPASASPPLHQHMDHKNHMHHGGKP